MNCLSENTLRAYHDGELPEAERSEAEAHLAGCAQCRNQLQQIAAAAIRVQGRLQSLDPSAEGAQVDPQIALARFRAEHGSGEEHVPFFAALFGRRWRFAWLAAAAVLVILAGLAFPSGRSLAQRILATLRVEKVQPLRLDLSSLDANRPLQQMLSQMISDKVVVTTDEKPQRAASAKDAGQLTGFGVRVLSSRVDSPQFTVEGQHAFHITIDRERLQGIFDQAGRPDLLLPATIDGATISVEIPRAVRLQYGDCPRRNNDAEDSSGNSTASGDCVTLEQAPSPVVSVPSDLNLQQLAEIGLQLAGMTATQSREFCQTVDWRSTLVLPLPRFVQSYEVVEVDGAQGTLINQSSRRGPGYVLIWVKNGIIYCLAGQGDSRKAIAMANSLD